MTNAQRLQRMSDYRRSVREAAIQEAKALSPEALLGLIQQGRRRLQRRCLQRWLLFCAFFIGYHSLDYFWYIVLAHHSHLLPKFVDQLLFQVLFWSFLLTAFPLLRTSLAETLNGREDTAFLPHVLTLAKNSGLELDYSFRAETLLAQMLPKLRREQMDALTPELRRMLVRPLKTFLTNRKSRRKQSEYVLLLLKTLEQAGDKRELPLVEYLAAMACHNDRERQVRQAADACLPYLQIRADEQRHQATLLRAASQKSPVPDVLLRPSHSHLNTTPEEQLLRSTTAE